MNLRRAPVTSDSVCCQFQAIVFAAFGEEAVSFGCNPLYLDWRGGGMSACRLSARH